MLFAGALEDILCIQKERQVGNDNTVPYNNRVLQIPATVTTTSRRQCGFTRIRMAPLPSFMGRGAWGDIPPQARFLTNLINRQRERLRLRLHCVPDAAKPFGFMDNAAAFPTIP